MVRSSEVQVTDARNDVGGSAREGAGGRGRNGAGEAAGGLAKRGGLRGRLRRRRRTRGLPGPDRALRRHGPRPGASEGGWPQLAQALARSRHRFSGPDPDRAWKLAREGRGHRRRRRRLRGQAVSHGRGAGPAPRVDPARQRPDRARAEMRRGDARSARRKGHARGCAGEAHRPRVPRAVLPHAPSRRGGVAERADRAHLCPELRSRLQHGRGVHRAPAAQAGRLVHRDGPWHGLPRGRGGVMALRSLRSRLVLGAILWTVGIVAVVNHVSLVLLHRGPLPMGVLHYTLMGILAVGVLIAGLSQVGGGLKPLQQLRARLAELRAGRKSRIDGAYPSEVHPLVEDLNALLDDRDQRVTRALAKAGDLAHGLKTPLAVVAQEAERARAAGHAELAGTLNEQVERMRRQIEYHLAHARAAASRATPQARCAVIESVEALAR